MDSKNSSQSELHIKQHKQLLRAPHDGQGPPWWLSHLKTDIDGVKDKNPLNYLVDSTSQS